jgi:subtilisin family serine protease
VPGFDGTGWTVAVLDTGVDKTHPFLNGKVVDEAYYSSNGSCPNGSMEQIGAGASVPCTYAAGGCQHGTHVAGIAAGRGTSFSGVARGANIIAMQVFSRLTGSACTDAGVDEDPCALTYRSDYTKGLERVYTLRGTYQIAAVNLSLGGGEYTTQAACDEANLMQKMAIDNLRSVGIATVVASGNNDFSDGLNAPACLSSAVSVGATTKTDMIPSFSNSAPFLSLLAPGVDIRSSIPGGGFAAKDGTSMATPHVAGAWAIMKQKFPAASVSSVLNALQTTGLPIQDPSNGVTTPRIRIFHALQRVIRRTDGVRDVNRDGQADLVWRDTTTGVVSVWLLNGFQVRDSRNISGPIGLAAQIVP